MPKRSDKKLLPAKKIQQAPPSLKKNYHTSKYLVYFASVAVVGVAVVCFYALDKWQSSDPLEAWLAYKQPVLMAAAGLEAAPQSIGDMPTFEIHREKDLTLESYRKHYEGLAPVILEGVMKGAPCMEPTWLEKSIVNSYGHESVVFSAFLDGGRHQLSSPLKHFVEGGLHQNTLEQFAYVQDEFLLSRHPELSKDCPARPSLLESGDHFKLLPKELVPRDAYLLWGGQYSRSTLHVDPYNWTGTNFVLRGRKKWRLVPPGGHDQLVDAHQTRCGFALECVKYQSPADLFGGSLPKGLPLWEGTLYPGDVLVIPSGWWHQAMNMEETVAIASQSISPRGGSWSAIAQILRFHAKENLTWSWKDLPPFPRNISGVSEAEAAAIFSSFASSIPIEARAKGRKLEDNLANWQQQK